MKKHVKLIGLIVLLLAFGTFLTLTYLQDLTSPVTNTFTVGNVHITLSEPAWDTLAEHRMVPSASFQKDPTVVVKANGENCYVAAKITIPAMLKPLISLDINTTNWSFVKQVGDDHYYEYKGEIPASTVDTALAPLFYNVTVLGTVTNAQLEALGVTDKELTVQAFAIQSAGFGTQTEALAQWIPS